MKIRLLASAAALVAAFPAHAQDSDDRRVRIGLGAQLQPEFKGADEREVAPLFDIDIARGTKPFGFEAPDDSYGFSLVSGDGFAAGPAARIEGSRKNKDVGAAVGKVSATLEAGAFAEYMAGENFRVRGELLKGLGGHKGLVGSLGADYVLRDGDLYVFSVGPRLLFSNSRYQRVLFGIESPSLLPVVLPAYRPDSGIHAVALASGLSYQFNPQFGTFGFARYERLVRDAAKSPIVRDFGSRNQMSAGIGLSYTFTVKQ